MSLVGRRRDRGQHRGGLGAEERELFGTGGAEAEVSDLAKPENRYERPQGKLLEAHTPIRTPDGLSTRCPGNCVNPLFISVRLY